MNAGKPTRRLSSWIDSYVEHTEILPSPPLFRKWAGIFYVAAAMERKVWVRTMGSPLYPGLFVLLVGPPGIGKGQAIRPGELFLRDVPGLHVGPSDMTAASLIDSLNESVRRLILPGPEPFIQFNSVTVISRELGVLIPAWDTALMNNMTDIYDGFTVDQKRRGKDLRIKIEHPQINLLGACTPAYLNEVLPAGAWDQGFISRTILVYSGEKTKRDPFIEDMALTGRLSNDLLHDLKGISVEYGPMSFTQTATMALKAWINGGCKPEPTHLKLQNYNSRRIAHLIKLCMIASMSHSNDKIVTIENYSEALNWLMEAEVYMPDIFKSMTSGGDNSTIEETWNYVWNLYSKEKRPIAEHRIIHFIRERAPAHSVMKILEIMVKSYMLKITVKDNSFQGYEPTSREQRLSGSPMT